MLRVEGSQVLEFVWGNRTSVILYGLRHLFEIMEKSFAISPINLEYIDRGCPVLC